MRKAGRVLCARLPMGVETRKRHTRSGCPEDCAGAGAEFSPALVEELLRDMVKSLARAPEEKVTHATIKFWLHGKRSAGATVRVQVREMRAAHGENRKCFRAAPEEVPSLRRQGRSSDYRPLVSVQGRGLVRDRLRGKIHRRRKQDRKASRGNQRRAGERGFREGKPCERGRGEREFGQRDEREKNGKEKISLAEEFSRLKFQRLQVFAKRLAPFGIQPRELHGGFPEAEFVSGVGVNRVVSV